MSLVTAPLFDSKLYGQNSNGSLPQWNPDKVNLDIIRNAVNGIVAPLNRISVKQGTQSDYSTVATNHNTAMMQMNQAGFDTMGGQLVVNRTTPISESDIEQTWRAATGLGIQITLDEARRLLLFPPLSNLRAVGSLLLTTQANQVSYHQHISQIIASGFGNNSPNTPSPFLRDFNPDECAALTTGGLYLGIAALPSGPAAPFLGGLGLALGVIALLGGCL